MIVKKDGSLFSDVWYYHVCEDMDDREKNSERVLYDTLTNKWQFFERRFEVSINFCPFCGMELRTIDPQKSSCSGKCEMTCDDSDKGPHDTGKEIECSINCMYCSQEITICFDPELHGCPSGECTNCQAEIEFNESL